MQKSLRDVDNMQSRRLSASRRVPSATSGFSLKVTEPNFTYNMKLRWDGELRWTAEWSGELDPACQTTQRAYFQPKFSNSISQPLKIKSKHALMEFKQDQYYPSPWNTQTSPGFAEFGILTIFALKSGVTRSIIEQFSSFNTNMGYSDFTQSI